MRLLFTALYRRQLASVFRLGLEERGGADFNAPPSSYLVSTVFIDNAPVYLRIYSAFPAAYALVAIMDEQVDIFAVFPAVNKYNIASTMPYSIIETPNRLRRLCI
ncbi:MAG TPA: hypothetical protein DIU00_02400 [Phycisphaerales bacterium]|nr:hypothetical protein [Phycisphaerales bacterium]